MSSAPPRAVWSADGAHTVAVAVRDPQCWGASCVRRGPRGDGALAAGCSLGSTKRSPRRVSAAPAPPSRAFPGSWQRTSGPGPAQQRVSPGRPGCGARAPDPLSLRRPARSPQRIKGPQSLRGPAGGPRGTGPRPRLARFLSEGTQGPQGPVPRTRSGPAPEGAAVSVSVPSVSEGRRPR